MSEISLDDLTLENKGTHKSSQYGDVMGTIKTELNKIVEDDYLIIRDLQHLIVDKHKLPSPQQGYNRITNATKTKWFQEKFATEVETKDKTGATVMAQIKNNKELRCIMLKSDLIKLKK